jgi:hypothetical protein
MSENRKVEDHPWEVSEINHPTILKYKPNFLGSGGEHVVYEVQGHPDVVVKARKDFLKKFVKLNIDLMKKGMSVKDNLAEYQTNERVLQYLKNQRERYKSLRSHFGDSHVPKQKEFVVKVPVTKEILVEIFDGNLDEITPYIDTQDPIQKSLEVITIAMVQERVEELNNPDKISFNFKYAEKKDLSENNEDGLDPESYFLLTKGLVFGSVSIGDPNTTHEKLSSAFLEVQSTEEIDKLLELGKDDEDLREVLSSLVDKIISFSKESGEILDLAGEDNTILFKKDGKWDFILVDARYPGVSILLPKAKEIIRKLSLMITIDPQELNDLVNVLNFVRTINGLALILGLPSRIDIVPEGVNIENIDILAIAKDFKKTFGKLN